MRVALFFDGKNFYSGWRDQTGRQQLDFVKLSQWLVTAAGGARLWAAHYYTGVETGPESGSSSQQSLGRFLDWLDEQPGYFVQRFPRRPRTITCEHCERSVRYTEEKEVDTTLVADMVRLAAVGAYDVAVLISGDGDFGSALDAVRALGKQTLVATWGQMGLSTRLRQASFDRLNLLNGLEAFSRDGVGPASVEAPEPAHTAAEESVAVGSAVTVDQVPVDEGGLPPDLQATLEELKRAEARCTERGMFLGANYFATRWQSDHLPPSVDKRREHLTSLEALGRIEVYVTPTGERAIKSRSS